MLKGFRVVGSVAGGVGVRASALEFRVRVDLDQTT